MPNRPQDDRIQQFIDRDIGAEEQGERNRGQSIYSCPDCGGVLWQFDEDFGCHTGHRFTADSLVGRESEELEAALYSAMRLLKERSTLMRQLALAAASDSGAAQELRDQAELDDEHARLIRTQLLENEDEAETADEVAAADVEDRGDRLAEAVRSLLYDIRRPPDD
jgi:two-component system chemotaxis response regulator CheB